MACGATWNWLRPLLRHKEDKVMKKNYTAPEAEILCFRPMEELASNLTMDDLLGKGGPKDAAQDGAPSAIDNIKFW